MKRKLLVLLLSIVAIVQCTPPTLSTLLSTNKIESQFFTIGVNRDTTLITKNGATISISKGSISSSTGTIKLEVKEAYTIADILMAGLTTNSGKQILSSGGMICITPADKSPASIIRPISISLPSTNFKDGMSLFRGIQKSNGTIEWTDPKMIAKPMLSKSIDSGKLLFNTNCAACHHPTKDATGPQLAFLDKRRDWKWLTAFTRNCSEMIAGGEKLAVCVYKKYGQIQMPAFPDLTDEQIQNIFDYVNLIASDIDPKTAPDFKKSFDSCVLFNQKSLDLDSKRKKLIDENGPQVTLKKDSVENTVGIAISGIANGMRLPTYNSAVIYRFEIDAFGWYNVDKLIKEIPGLENSELSVRISGKYTDAVNVYLIIPSQKVLAPAANQENKPDTYVFLEDDGIIPLPQNSKAYVLAFSEYENHIYFSQTEFITGLKQHLEMQLSPVSREAFNSMIKNIGINDLTIKVDKTKNADKIIATDSMLRKTEIYKPKDCDCLCMYENDSAYYKGDRTE